MFLVKSAQHVRLDDREALGGAISQILVHFLAIGPLEEQPASVAEVKERLAALIHEVSPVGADLEFEVLDGTCRGNVRRCRVATNRYQQRRRQWA